ncbi:hypothetical protein BRYFOR_05320 [Marvinbryantia formatexigens DSM 14469]|uniref:Uncharacterized protein n=1 Tax=Marvinbryantia formatexigens DSM 14469 TaxID=478749 RepID=C6L9N0_9FIRM|nr:hypothetical protein BRYFOR_05320 [Marvinbryantia formatexigens DSM 14469]
MEHRNRKGNDLMKKTIMVIVALAMIAGITITSVCLPEDRFDY